MSRTALGVAAALMLVGNATVVVARTGADRSTAAAAAEEVASARSASLAVDALDEKSAASAPPGASLPPGARPPPIAPPPSTPTPTSPTSPSTATTARPRVTPPSTSVTTPSVTALGVVGPGLYVVGADGSGARRLSSDVGFFTWSPDGTRLAYSSGQDLVVIRADGSGRRTLSAGHGAMVPAWSPDGTRLAFSRSLSAEGGGAYVVAADGSGAATLVDPLGYLVAWTPDSRLVVLTSPPAAASSVILYDNAGGRRVLGADGSNIVQPAPSPDGRVVAYMNNRIVVAATDGAGSRQLTGECCANEYVGSPLRWSPDSRLLAFTDQGDIKVIGSDGTGERVLAPDAVSPGWAPDGRLLALVDQSTVRADGLLHMTLQVVRPDGSDRHTIFDAGPTLSVQSPQWSPSGRQIAVVTTSARPF